MAVSARARGELLVRIADDADRPEIAALIAEMIPGCDVGARFRWLYDRNPAGRAQTWLAIAPGGEVAGCTSLFPFRLWLDGTVVRGALGGDGYVRPAFRRRGIGGLLHDASRRDMAACGLQCMYGAPGAMNVTPLKHGGSRELGHVARWARPVVWGLPSRSRLEPMRPHDVRVNAVWNEARRGLRLAAVRDAAFYTWRFLEAPGGREPAYVIVRGGQPIGACAVEPMFGGATLRIVDLVAVPGRWHACLRAIARFAARTTRARVLDIKLFAPDGRRRRMWLSGFVERESKPFLCMIPDGGDRRLVDPDRWFYGGADSDLDSLE
jgi:hypothetical protein